MDSDFTFLNERLAEHYGVPGVTGAKMRKVTLPTDSVRGGLHDAGQRAEGHGQRHDDLAGAARLLDHGTHPGLSDAAAAARAGGRTGYSRRGHASASSLKKHRDDASCAVVPRQMDPPGFALESFDVMGGWRDRYRAVNEDVHRQKGVGMNGQAFAFHYALPVDCAGDCPMAARSRTFASSSGCCCRTRSALARNLAKQLTIYATGAPVRFSDASRSKQIRAANRRAAIRHAQPRAWIVQSELFQTNEATQRIAMRYRKPGSCPIINRRRVRPRLGTASAISRRRLLHGAGVALSLPFLDSMAPRRSRGPDSPARAWTREQRRAGCSASATISACCRSISSRPRQRTRLHAFAVSASCSQEHRHDFTVFSGVSHPNVDGGHPSDISFLTAAPHPASSSFRNTISLDQHIAERIGTLTRFPSLTLAVNGNRSLSWTGTGVAIPPEQSAAEVFRQLFLQGTPDRDRGADPRTRHRPEHSRRRGGPGARTCSATSARAIADRLDQYFTSVRDLEQPPAGLARLGAQAQAGRQRPAPIDPTSPAQYMEKVKVMYDLARLAFETDSTRAITLMLNSVGTPVVQIAGRDDHRRLSQPFASRQGRGQAASS